MDTIKEEGNEAGEYFYYLYESISNLEKLIII
jgi:hypothetical protein